MSDCDAAPVHAAWGSARFGAPATCLRVHRAPRAATLRPDSVLVPCRHPRFGAALSMRSCKATHRGIPVCVCLCMCPHMGCRRMPTVDAPFRALEKSKVLQECRKFHDQTFTKRHPKRCCQLITKLLVLLTHGEVFSSTEVTDVFFGVTKLFESEDGNLRRMVYLFLKEVADATNPSELIIVVQSLCQDMNKSDSKSELYRANACRVLCRILDVRDQCCCMGCNRPP